MFKINLEKTFNDGLQAGFSVELTVAKAKKLLVNGLDRNEGEAKGRLLEGPKGRLLEGAAFYSLVNQGETEADFDDLLKTASDLQKSLGRPVLVHLRAGDVRVAGIAEFLKRAEHLALSNFLVITGDKKRLVDGFSTGAALLSALRDAAGDRLMLASTIDVNPLPARTATQSLEKVLEKKEGGAELFITQIFFDDSLLLEMKKQLPDDVVILPGLVGSLQEKQVNWLQNVLGIHVPQAFLSNPDGFNAELKARLNKRGLRFFHYFGMD